VSLAIVFPLGATADSWNFSGAADSTTFAIWAYGSRQRGMAIQTTNPRSAASGELKTSPLPPGVTYYSGIMEFRLASEGMVDVMMTTSRTYANAFVSFQSAPAFRFMFVSQ
jgi:hypothetical protein